MLDLFEENNKIRKIKDKSSLSRKFNIKFLRQFNRDENCLNQIDSFPKENEVCSFVSKGMSDAGSFLYSVHQKEGIINEAIICTWTISKQNVKKILEYVDLGYIKKLYVLLNDGLLKTNSKKPIYAFMRLEFDKRKDKISYAVANSHAKIQLYNVSEKYLTISGSGNWSENPRIENYILIGGKKTYDFHAKWIKEIIK